MAYQEKKYVEIVIKMGFTFCLIALGNETKLFKNHSEKVLFAKRDFTCANKFSLPPSGKRGQEYFLNLPCFLGNFKRSRESLLCGQYK